MNQKGAGDSVPRHTSMPPRKQRTPFGLVTLTSKWKADRKRYFLMASGPLAALKWMFPIMEGQPEQAGNQFRHAFNPHPEPVTIERELRKIATRWQDAWNARLHDPMEGAQDDGMPTTLAELFEYLTEKRHAKLKPNSREADQNDRRVWAQVMPLSTPLHAITDDLLQEGFDTLCTRFKPSSANRALGTLKTYLTWAFNKGLLVGAPHKNVKQARVPRSHRDIQWWTQEERKIALRAAREVDQEIREASSRNQNTNTRRNGQRGLDRTRLDNYATAELFVAMGCYLGLRVEEAIMQRWQDLDLDAVGPSGDPQPVCHVVPHSGWEPKDKESRTIPIHRDLFEILKRHRQPSGFLLQPKVSRAKTGGTKRVYRYNPSKIWSDVLKRAMQAGAKRITPYGMRHTFASNLLMRSVSDVKVARWLGHADTRMVHRHYGHLLAFDDDINLLG